MAFDVEGAFNAGYSPTDVADYLGKEKKFDVSGAREAGYSDQDIILHLSNIKAAQKEGKEGFVGSLKKGAEQVASTAKTAYESVTKSPEEAFLASQKRQKDIESRYGTGTSLEDVKKAYKEKGLGSAALEVLRQTPIAIAEQGANLASTLGAAGAGAMVAGPIGAVAGAALPSYIQQYGGNIERQGDVQQAAGKPLDISRGKAALTAIPQTALDVAETFIPLGGRIASKVFGPTVGKLLGAGEGAAAEKLAKEGLLATIAKGTATGVIAEVPAEVTQQMLERLQAGLPLLDQSAMKEYGETAFDVSLLGPLGILGRVANKSDARAKVLEAQQKAKDTNEPQEIPLLTYDPNLPNTRGTETFIVYPDGRVAPSQKAAEDYDFEKKYAPQPGARITPETKGEGVLYGTAEGEVGKSPEEVQQAKFYKNEALQRQAELNRVISPEMIKDLGIGKTASIFKDTGIMNQSLSNPDVADATRAKLMDIQKAHKNEDTKKKIADFLNRPEFITPKYVNELLNPPLEMTQNEAKALDKQQFASVNANGEIQVRYGDVIQKDGKQYAKYDGGGGRYITDEVMVNPNPTTMESWLLSKEKDNIAKIPDDFKAYLAKRKISTKEMSDLNMNDIPKNKKGSGIYKTYFSGQGESMDTLTNDAMSNGFISSEDLLRHGKDEVDGMRELVRMALIDNERIPYTPQNFDAVQREYDIGQRQDALEEKSNEPAQLVTKEKPTEPVQTGIEELTPEEKAPVEAEASVKAAERFEGAPAVEPPRAEVSTPFADKFIADEKKLVKQIRAALNRMGLNDVGLKLEDAVHEYVNGKMTSVNGSYFNKLIRLSLAGDDMFRTMSHEALHAMKALGFFSPADWKILEQKAKSEWMAKYDIASKYGSEPMEVQLEEAIAFAFADHNKQLPAIKRIMNAAINALKALGNVFRANGYRKAEDIFQEAAAGKLKATKEIIGKARASIVPDYGLEAGSKFFKPMSQEDRQKGYKNVLKNPITLKNGIRLSGFTDPINQTTFHGYDKNGQKLTIQREYVNPDDIVFSKDSNKTAEYFKNKLKQSSVRAEVPENLKANLNDVDPAYADKIIKQFSQEKATVKEKFEGFKKGFFNRMVTGLFDEFRAIKEYSPTAYMQARLSKSIDGGLQGLLEHGQVFMKDGALDIRPNTKGLIDILAPLGKEVDQYQIWKALNRDAKMPADKRSFDTELIAGRDNLIKGNINGKSRKSIYETALKEENELNKSVLDIAKETGLIDQEAYNKFSNDIYYIPFYKQMEGGDVQAISQSSKLTGQYFSKALKGGAKKTNDLMENVLMNWSHILSAAMKNQAAANTIKAAKDFDVAERATPMGGKYPPGSVKIMEDGKPVHYTLTDPDLVDAISTISYLGPKSAFLDVAKGFTNILRQGITLSPAYKIRNLIRDSIQSAAISELSPNMFSNVYNGLAMSRKGHPTFMSALAGGGIFEMGVAHEGNQAKLIKKLIEKGVKDTTILDTSDKIKGILPELLRQYNELGNKFENANRLALYQKLIDSDKTHLEASYAARDLMDFSMQGQFRAVKVIGSVVPFFNARLQGLYKLGRDGITPTYRVICNATTGKPLEVGDKQKAMHFTIMSSAVMLASMALYSMYKDDEDFQRREDWDRDNYWWFKIGETQYRIPKPFEIGALGTVAERTLEQISDQDVEGKVFFKRMNSILTDTFSMNPMPQIFKPLIDIYSNKDSFTGAPIESAGMENLSKQERQNDRTSGIAIALGGISEGAAKVLTFNPDAQGLSPIQMDYMVKAYLGWAGATAVATADRAIEPFEEGTKVHPPVIDQLAMGFIKTEPETRSKYLTNFYQNNANLQSAMADMRHYAELGESEKVQKILEEKGNEIALSKAYDQTTKQFSKIRKAMKMIENDKSIPEDERRAEMNRLKIIMSDMARDLESVRKTTKE